MTDPQQPTASQHAAHDLTLIAALAARTSDLTETQMVAARDQLATCDACTALLSDIVALQTALPVTSTPRRPRDFSLTPADAARLRRTGWRRVLGFVGSARDSFSRPLAIGFTTLGLAGLLLAALPSMMLSGAGGAAALAPAGQGVEQAAPAAGEAYGTDQLAASAAPAASAAAAASAAPTAGLRSGEEDVFSGANPAELDSGRDVAGDGSLLALRDDASGLSVMFVVAGSLLIAGLGLFALRWSARRLL